MASTPPRSHPSSPVPPYNEKARRSPSPTRKLPRRFSFEDESSSAGNFSSDYARRNMDKAENEDGPPTPTLWTREGREMEMRSFRDGRPEDEERLMDDGGKEEREVGKESAGGRAGFLFWTAVNTLATIGIVFTNKAIFSDPNLKRLQTLFACFHFICTSLTLTILSSQACKIRLFTPRPLPTLEILPLAAAMCLNVLLPNASLAHSTITFYQIARILLTPLVALINYAFHSISIPKRAAICLIPVILGVWTVTYYDSLKGSLSGAPSTNTSASSTAPAAKRETPLGAIFAFTGVLASSIYTVLIGSYHRRTKLSSMQLLYNQAPLSALLLLFAAPLTDTLPYSIDTISGKNYFLVFLSGLLAALINLSQFFIVAGAGAVSSTVVGHAKTCAIVALGWAVGKGVDPRAGWGAALAVGGIVAYSWVMLESGRKA